MTGAPLHLAGNNRPVTEEVATRPTRVDGRLPADLCGRFYRNGPNPRTGWSDHFYDGDGMVHAVALGGGEARWYRNRYVRTPLHAHPGSSRMALAFDPATGRVDHAVTTANTSVVAHAGRLLALEEGGFPYELTPELDTVGPWTFGGALTTPMTAHPKVCPATRELLGFGYQLRPPFVTCFRVSPTGVLDSVSPITLPRATMMHDFAITATTVVLFDSPIVFDPAALGSGGPPWRWDDDHGARIGLLPRGGGDADVRWFDVEPGHLSHAVNAHDDGGRVVLWGTRLPRTDTGGGLPVLHEWVLDRASGLVRERALDETSSEYPRVAEDRIGRSHRYAWTVSFALDAEPDRTEIYRYDLTAGVARTAHAFPTGHTCGEPVFVPRAGATAEDDGYVLTFAHDPVAGTSYLAVLDGTDPAAACLAEVHLPVRVPSGFHGTWVPDG